MLFKAICSILQAHNPVRLSAAGCHQAAVAMLLREIDECPEMFFIQRAFHESDPWSGQIAFPGGSRDSDDPDTLHTARRETMEEVGVCLDDCPVLGQLDDQKSHIPINARQVVINCYAFEVPKGLALKNSEEVQDSFWIPVNHLLNPDRQMTYQINPSDAGRPAIRLDDDKVLWGLTYRFVQFLTARITTH